ncbi:MAG: hypothetical protein U0P81_05965 [Holophagaceae bacterium]
MTRRSAFPSLRLFGLALLLAAGASLAARDGDNNGNGTPTPPPTGPGTPDAAARREWWRLRLGGALSPEFMRRAMNEAARQRLLFPQNFPGEAAGKVELPEGTPLAVALGATTWTNLGPTKSSKIQNSGLMVNKLTSGRVRVILPDPADANTVYVLTSGGGLWKTSNFEDSPPTWRNLTDQLGSTAGGSASFGKAKSGAGAVIHLGLGDPFDEGVGGFMVRSSDAGATWSAPIQLSGTVGASTYTATKVLDVEVDDTAATEATTTVLVGTNAGLFRSTDGGATYSLVNNAAFNGKLVWSLARVGANTWIAAAEDPSVGGGTGVIMRSTNGGATWAAIAAPLAGAGRITLSNVPGEATVYAFAAATGDGAQLDLYKSTNGGNNWAATTTTSGTAPATTNTDQANNNYMHTSGYYSQMLLVDPQDGTRNTLYIGGDLSSAKNTNGGATGGTAATKWNLQTNWFGKFSLPFAHGGFQCAAKLDLGAKHRVFLGTSGGLFYSDDGGTTWNDSKNEGLVTQQVFAMTSGPLSGCGAWSVLAGVEDNATHNRVGSTSTFDITHSSTTVGTLGNYDGFGVGWSQATDTYSFSSLGYNNIYRATVNPPDDATKWTAFITGLTTPRDASNYFLVTPIIAAPPGADPTGTLFYTYANTNNRRVFRTVNGGNWTQAIRLSAGATVRPVSHGIGIHPTDANRVATASEGGIVNISTNALGAVTARNLNTLVPASGGRTWQGFNSSVTWVDNYILFATSESTTPNSIHVARSADGGATWAAAETGLPDLPVVKIVVDPGDPNTLYAATWLGVYRTTNSGTSWSLFGTGLPQALVSDLYIHPSGAFLRAAIYGRGIWQVGPTPTYTVPVFTTQPTGGTYTPGTTFTLSAAVSNTYPTVTYQWRRNGVNLANGGTENITGATTPTLTVTNPTCGLSAGDYTLVATNCMGPSVSDTATMASTLPPPVITIQPANVWYNNAASQTIYLSVGATGATSYQWYWNTTALTNGVTSGVTFSGVTTPTLTISTPVNGGAGGQYTCVISNGVCSVTSNIAEVHSINTTPANITQQPADATLTAPNPATFTVTAGGGGDGTTNTLTFQWLRNGVNLTNGVGGYSWTNASIPVNSTTATASSTLTVNPTADFMNGSVFSCTVSNGIGPATSNGAKLSVLRQYTPATAVSITPSTSLPVSRTGGGWPPTFTAAGSGSLVQGTATPAPASAYQYQFWLYLDDALGWVMVRDYSTTATYTLPAIMQPGVYGIGVDVRTSSTVYFDAFNAIDYFTITPSAPPAGGPAQPAILPSGRPAFLGGSWPGLTPEPRPRASRQPVREH